MSFGEQLARQLDLAAGVKRPEGYKADVGSKRGFNLRLAYVLSPKTGVPLERAAELIGVSRRTIRAWQRGRTPSRASREKLEQTYTGFLDTKYRARLSKRAGRLAAAMDTNALRLTNSEGEQRYYKPRRRWDELVEQWSIEEEAGMDAIWADIVSDWSYPEPWQPELIEVVEIV